MKALFLGLALLLTCADEPGATPAPKAKGWITRHEGFVEEAKKGGFEVLFQGDSITDGWRNGPAKKIWDDLFAPLKAVNFGISGDRTQHVLWRLQNGEFEGVTLPKVVVLMIGTNNIGQKDNPESPASAIAGVEAILKLIHQKSERTNVLLLTVFPRGQKPDDPLRAKVKEINAGISKLGDDRKTVKVLDIGDKFLEPDGTIAKEVMPDFLHLTAHGYQIWADAIKEPLAELLK
ncbi:MAG TPA: GDSL-type esterase/lipase family protein [Planctomycetota bacterium]|nr:GDSL-type esterase/lipase family protein [Planctomycetota bacterium]